jgi:uncharacterized membrane protein
MNQNVGSMDKRVRTALGAVLGLGSLAALAGAVSLPILAAPVLGAASLIMLVTATAGTCPIYSLLGVDTCPVSPGGSR